MQRPENQRPEQSRSQRTQPALPGATALTALVAQQEALSPMASARKKRPLALSRALLQFVVPGLLLAFLYLALYPLLAFAPQSDAVAQLKLTDLFPWSPLLLWPSTLLLARFSWLDPALGEANRTNAWLLALALAFVCLLLAMWAGQRVQRARLSVVGQRLVFGCILLFAMLFAGVMAFAPLTNTVFTQDLLLSGLYGRMVAFYHVNPYVAMPTMFAQDFFEQALKAHQVASYGPVWLDISMLATLFAQNSLARELLTFRLLGLVAHLLNCFFLWVILGHIKPERRFSGVLFYAWNPLVLLLGIAQPHQELIVIAFLLLAIFFFAHHASLPGWVFLLLAALCNPLYLLLVPLFLMVLVKRTRLLSAGRRFAWWLGILAVAVLVVTLAYLPYWPGWGLNGVAPNFLQVFWPGSAQNSLDAALLHLPVHLPAPLLWVLAPHRWTALSLVVIGGFLCFGLWLADTLEMVLFFASWQLLLALLLLPIYWPWYVLVPLVLALASANSKTKGLMVLLIPGALFCYDLLQWQTVWDGLALACLGVPLVLWGWSLFFASTWQMVHAQEQAKLQPSGPLRRFSRPPWLSRPSWPGRDR